MSKEQSSEQPSEKKQIHLDVNYRIKRGEPKQQILEDLSPLYKDKAYLVRKIETTPSLVMRSTYSLVNYMLAAFLLIALVLDIIAIIKTGLSGWKKMEFAKLIINSNVAFSIILDAAFFVGVLLYRINTYSWIATRALVTLIALITSYSFSSTVKIDTLVFISFGLIVISFVVGLFLSVKLCPPRIPKIIEVDIDGTEKINKTIYVFPD